MADEQLDQEQVDEAAELAAEEAAFEAEFEVESEIDSSNLVANVATPDDEPGEPAPAANEATDADDELAAPPDRLQEIENRLNSRMRNIEGHFGGLKSQIQTALEARKAGEEAPTTKEIKEASGSNEKLDSLKEEFPEWADAITEQMTALEAKIGTKIDPDQIQGNLSDMMATAITNSTTRLREVLRVDVAHPDWETTINSDEFQHWKDSQSEEVQALADSESAGDAIKMLNAYSDSTSQAGDEVSKKDTENKKRRLESAVAPTSGRIAAREKGTTEEEEFLAAFNA